jgi:hypothetical protein
MIKKLAIASLSAAFMLTGTGLLYSQNSTTSGAVLGVGPTPQQGGVVSDTGETRGRIKRSGGDKGTIGSATGGGGRIRDSGELPRPRVQDNPQTRCLAPSGIC